jgi:hypothetical protein
MMAALLMCVTSSSSENIVTAGRVPSDLVHRARCNWSAALVVGSLGDLDVIIGTREGSKYRGKALVAFAACCAIAIAATAYVAFVASIVTSLQLCAGFRILGFGSFCCGGGATLGATDNSRSTPCVP